jgi:Aldehyde dehydrogenase family
MEREVRAIRFGDPMDAETEIGTLIDEEAAERLEGMIGRAMAAGARLVCAGERKGAPMGPTVLTNVDARMDVVSEEIFGPALTVQPYDDIEPIFRALAMSAFRSARTGGVIVNGTSRWRSDQPEVRDPRHDRGAAAGHQLTRAALLPLGRGQRSRAGRRAPSGAAGEMQFNLLKRGEKTHAQHMHIPCTEHMHECAALARGVDSNR